MTSTSEPVVVVGAGPVGLMLACELALAGVRTVVLEKLAEPTDSAPGMAINPTVVELLDQRGLMDELREDAMEWPEAHFAQIFLRPTELGEAHEFSHLVPQTYVERHLEEHARKLGAEVWRGHEVTGLTQDAGGVTVRVRAAGAEREVRGAYLVGCDGARSTVRDLAGIDFPGVESPFYGIIGDVAAELNEQLIGQFGAHQCPTGLYTLGPSGPGRVRVATGEFDTDPPDHSAPVTEAELRAHIQRLTGADTLPGTPIWLARWGNVTRQADRYRSGRVFVAGDAAHVHFPLGGQAMSTGIEDAVNLAWKLAAALGGWAPGDLLDSYHAERHPVGARACLTTRAQAALMYPMARVEPLREVLGELARFPDVNEYLVRMAGGLDVRYPMAGSDPERAHPLVGRRLPTVALRTADGPGDAARVPAPARGLLLDFTGRAAVASQLAGWADRVDLRRVEPTSEIEVNALLLRPDGRVAWVDAEPGDEAGLVPALHAWFGVSGS